MNATRMVSQISIASDPAQISDAAPGGSLNSTGRGQDFAATLSNVGAKSARRQAAGKAHDGAQSGGSLPTPGNLSPPPANAAMAAASTANPPVAGTAASAIAAANMTTAASTTPANMRAPGNTMTPGDGSPTGRDAAALRAEATKIEAASAAAFGAAASGGAVTDPVAGPAAMAADGRGGAAISGTQGQAALSPDAVLNSASSAPGSAAAAEPGADFAQAFGLPGTAAAGGAQTAVDAAAIDKASAARGAKEIPEAAGGRLPRARAGAAGTVIESAGRMDSAANTTTLPAVGSSDDTASTSVSGDSARDGGATLQTVIAAASSAAAGAAGVSSGASAEPQAGDSAGPVAVGAAARPAGRAGGLLEPPAPVVVPAAAASAARAAAGAEDAAALANSVESDKHAHGGSSDSLSTDANGMAGAAEVGPNATASTDATPTPTLKVAAGVDTPEFGHALADRVSWMVGNNLNGAKLQVNPSQLGPIEVRIAVQGAHAQVWLTSHSAVTRDALESSSQKLREMLGAQGFGQVSVDISQRSFQERSPQAQLYDWTPSVDGAASPASMSPSARPVHFSSSAVDAYA